MKGGKKLIKNDMKIIKAVFILPSVIANLSNLQLSPFHWQCHSLRNVGPLFDIMVHKMLMLPLVRFRFPEVLV